MQNAKDITFLMWLSYNINTPPKKKSGINGRMWCRRGGASLMCFCAQGGPTSLEPLQELGQLGFYHTSYTSGRLQANLFREGGHKYRKGV